MQQIATNMDEIEDLLDNYVDAVLTYTNSQTCNSHTYKKQEQDMDNAKYTLLSKISEKLDKAL